MAPKKTPDATPRVAAETHKALWDLVKDNFLAPISAFVLTGIKPYKGKDKDAEIGVWYDVVKTAFASGVDTGYVLGHDQFVTQAAARAAKFEAVLVDWTAFYTKDTSTDPLDANGDGESRLDPANEMDWKTLAIGFLIARGVDVYAPIYADGHLNVLAALMAANETNGALAWHVRRTAEVASAEADVYAWANKYAADNGAFPATPETLEAVWGAGTDAGSIFSFWRRPALRDAIIAVLNGNTEGIAAVLKGQQP